MSMANTIETNSTVKTTAVFSKNRKDRYLLKIEWDNSKKSLTIIITYPSSADELIFDQTTMLVRNGAVKNDFGSVSIINLFSSIDNPLPKTDKTNTSFVMRECDNADTIIVAYRRNQLPAIYEYLSIMFKLRFNFAPLCCNQTAVDTFFNLL